MHTKDTTFIPKLTTRSLIIIFLKVEYFVFIFLFFWVFFLLFFLIKVLYVYIAYQCPPPSTSHTCLPSPEICVHWLYLYACIPVLRLISYLPQIILPSPLSFDDLLVALLSLYLSFCSLVYNVLYYP